MGTAPKMNVQTLVDLSSGRLISGDPTLKIVDISADSRGAFSRGSLFVAIEGQHFDGHQFLKEASAKGAVAALISRSARVQPDDFPDLALIEVDDTLRALQQIAAGWREKFDIPVVGITGSNGKTVVKDMLASMLAQERTVYRSPGSYNSQLGVALSLLGLRAEHEVAIIEAGISRVGEMSRLEAMIRPTLGVITNIGLAHAAGLGDLSTTAYEKSQLLRNLPPKTSLFSQNSDISAKNAVLPADCDELRALDVLERSVTFSTKSTSSQVDFSLQELEEIKGGYRFIIRFPGGDTHEFTLNAPGEHNVSNAVAAMAAAAQLGASVESIRRGLAAFELSPLRLEMHTTQAGITFINDTYNSDPVSARAALGVLKHYAGRQRSIAILGAMLDLGARSEGAHAELGRTVADIGVDELICFGESARRIGSAAVEAGFSPEHIIYLDSMDALNSHLEAELIFGDVILFKASRQVGLERAAQRLLESVAPARLRVDLDMIRAQVHALKRHISPETGLIGVVKSFGYGNDATRISQTLVREGVDALAVAYADEAIPLRKRGMTLPILVTNALESEADKLVKYNLTPMVYSRRVVRAIVEQIERHNQRQRANTPQITRLAVHLEVDTGMNRVGLKPEDTLEFAQWLQGFDAIKITGVMTHLAAADDPAEDAFTLGQLDIFNQCLRRLRAAGIDPGLVHAANTAAAWRFPQARYDAVRVGLGLYGLSPSDAVRLGADNPQSALSFSTRIIHLKDIAPGESVGYNRSWVSKSARKIATIAAGYNDGFPRFMSNGGEVLIGAQRCPVVGRVCMDVAMVDVSQLRHVEVGDEVVIFGGQGAEFISIDEIARRGETISYEILCNISPRVRRIFVRQ